MKRLLISPHHWIYLVLERHRPDMWGTLQAAREKDRERDRSKRERSREKERTHDYRDRRREGRP